MHVRSDILESRNIIRGFTLFNLPLYLGPVDLPQVIDARVLGINRPGTHKSRDDYSREDYDENY